MKTNNSSSNERPTKRARRSGTDSQCGACTRLFSQSSLPKLNSKTGLAHQTRNACEASIRNGCDLCSLILKLTVDEFGSRWGGHESIVFRNFNSIKGSRAPIYTLRGTLESEEGCITLYPFAKQRMNLLTTPRIAILITNRQMILLEHSYREGQSSETYKVHELSMQARNFCTNVKVQTNPLKGTKNVATQETPSFRPESYKSASTKAKLVLSNFILMIETAVDQPSSELLLGRHRSHSEE